jgi:hypothetical protein
MEVSMSIRLCVFVNNEPVCTVTTTRYGVITAHVDWVKRPAITYRKTPSQRRHGPSLEEWMREELNLHVGGLMSFKNTPHHKTMRSHQRALKPGDTVTIQLLN